MDSTPDLLSLLSYSGVMTRCICFWSLAMFFVLMAFAGAFVFQWSDDLAWVSFGIGVFFVGLLGLYCTLTLERFATGALRYDLKLNDDGSILWRVVNR